MRLYKYLFFIIPLLFAVSCSSSRYAAKNVTIGGIQDIVLLNPESSISLIEKGDHAVYNDSMSIASKKLLTQIALSEPTKIPVVACEEYSEQDDVRLLDDFFVSFLKMDKASYEFATIPQQIDSLIEKTGHRYGMMLYATGFKRTKSNYRKLMAKYLLIDFAVGIATLGTVIPYAYPVEYNSTLYTIIVDSQENRVILVNHSKMDIDPFNEIEVRDQMLELFYDFTWQ